jgi:hypothetical protein
VHDDAGEKCPQPWRPRLGIWRAACNIRRADRSPSLSGQRSEEDPRVVRGNPAVQSSPGPMGRPPVQRSPSWGKVVLFRGWEVPSRRALLISPDETPGPDGTPNRRRPHAGAFSCARRCPDGRCGGIVARAASHPMRILVLIRRRPGGEGRSISGMRWPASIAGPSPRASPGRPGPRGPASVRRRSRVRSPAPPLS